MSVFHAVVDEYVNPHVLIFMHTEVHRPSRSILPMPFHISMYHGLLEAGTDNF